MLMPSYYCSLYYRPIISSLFTYNRTRKHHQQTQQTSPEAAQQGGLNYENNKFTHSRNAGMAGQA